MRHCAKQRICVCVITPDKEPPVLSKCFARWDVCLGIGEGCVDGCDAFDDVACGVWSELVDVGARLCFDNEGVLGGMLLGDENSPPYEIKNNGNVNHVR